MFTPPERTYERAGRAWVFRRPGIAGLIRIPGHVASLMAMGGAFPQLMDGRMGRAIDGRAILTEYLTACPSDWLAKRQDPNASRPTVDYDAVDPEEFADVAEAAIAFHESFRGVDARFSPRVSEE